MLVRASDKSWEWSVGSVAALAVSGVQITLAMLAMAQPALQTLPVLLFLTALTVADAVLIACAGLPIGAKIMAIAAIGTALIGTAMVHGTLGQRMAALPAATPTEEVQSAPATSEPRQRTVVGLTITTDGDALATAFGADVNLQVAQADGPVPSPPEVAATVDVDRDAGGIVYRMTWSIRRGADRRWCGQSIARHVSQSEAVRAFAAMIAAARAIPATEGLRCE